MKKTTTVLILILTSQILFAQLSQLRATWLTNVDSYVLTSDASIVEAVNYLSSIGINVIFPVVYNKGYTLYPSSIMDSLFNAPSIPDISFRNRDFLERLIIEAHRVGIEVIPWFEYGFSSSYSSNGGYIVAKFPYWVLKNNQDQLVVKYGFDWLSGINPEVQNFMISLMMEVIDKYDVDGVQFDDRLPAMPVEGGYDSVTVSIYKSEHNGASPPSNPFDANWKRWRADKLNQFFIRLIDSLKSRSPHLILSSSPTPYPCGYDEYLQDSRFWAQNVVDNIIPQLYRYDLRSYQTTLSKSILQIRNLKPEIYFAGVLIKSGSWLITPSLISQIINLNRTNNVNGESTFFYEGLRSNNNEIGNLLKINFYSEPALVPYRNGNIWRPKATIKNEDETGVTIIGNWSSYPMPGFAGQILRTNQTGSYAAIEYKINVPFDAYFDVFAYLTPNTPWTRQARYVIYSDDDSTEVIVNQSDLSRRGWTRIGTVYLTKGEKRVLKIDNKYLESGRYLVADGVMIMINRKLSPDVVITKVENEKFSQKSSVLYFELQQNYPNPFNGSTRISWKNNIDSYLNLRIYDILGREIETIAYGFYKSGEYSILYTPTSQMKSGVYFYQLSDGKNLILRKMVLIK